MNLSPAAMRAVLQAFASDGRAELLRALDDVDADADDLDTLLSRLAKAERYGCDFGSNYTYLLCWLVARAGPVLTTSCEAMEASVARAAGGISTVVMPRWALSMPITGALQLRVPSRPLVDGDDADLMGAYHGLLDHLSFLAGVSVEDRQLEMLNSSIPWRVVALVDRLEPEGDRGLAGNSIASRLEKLKSRTLGGSKASASDKVWWKVLDGSLCDRRHALSHLGDSGGWTFTRCVQASWTLDEARAAAAAIGLAVMDRVTRSLAEAGPPTSIFASVMDDTETAWLDDQDEG